MIGSGDALGGGVLRLASGGVQPGGVVGGCTAGARGTVLSSAACCGTRYGLLVDCWQCYTL
eukprot:COSAG02_NODE_1931_length_10329_cov_7.963930_3_plen_61_part_00